MGELSGDINEGRIGGLRFYSVFYWKERAHKTGVNNFVFFFKKMNLPVLTLIFFSSSVEPRGGSSRAEKKK